MPETTGSMSPNENAHRRLLLGGQGSPRLRKNSGKLHAAAVADDIELAREALMDPNTTPAEIKVELNRANDTGMTPLSIAVSRGNAEMTKLLLEHGADMFVKSKDYGLTLLEVAAEKSPEIEDMLRSEIRVRTTDASERLSVLQKEMGQLQKELAGLSALQRSARPRVDEDAAAEGKRTEEQISDAQRDGGKAGFDAVDDVPGVGKADFEATNLAYYGDEVLPEDHYFVRYKEEVASCVAALKQVQAHLWEIQCGNLFRVVLPPSSASSSRSGASALNTFGMGASFSAGKDLSSEVNFREFRVVPSDVVMIIRIIKRVLLMRTRLIKFTILPCGIDPHCVVNLCLAFMDNLQAGFKRLMIMAEDRKRHLDGTQPRSLSLRPADALMALAEGVTEDVSEVEQLAANVTDRILKKEVPVVKANLWETLQVGADGQIDAAGRSVAYWENLVFPKIKKTEANDGSLSDRVDTSKWREDPMRYVAQRFEVGRKFVSMQSSSSTVYISNVKLDKKEGSVQPGEVMGFLSGRYCRRRVFESAAVPGRESGGYFYDPGVYVLSRLCADRKVNGEPLVLVLDSPSTNPLNAIADVANDPLKIDPPAPPAAPSGRVAQGRGRVVPLEEVNADQRTKPNVEIVEVLVRGVPVPFIRALRVLQPDEELMLDRSVMWLGYSTSLRRLRLLRKTVQELLTRVGDV
ncbi:unnamed protein product [Amoebophrya sp. A25]|nr:unnamed protein product [Amoebophrya sp. A25]|eukprot:GSA25T00006214001.1